MHVSSKDKLASLVGITIQFFFSATSSGILSVLLCLPPRISSPLPTFTNAHFGFWGYWIDSQRLPPRSDLSNAPRVDTLTPPPSRVLSCSVVLPGCVEAKFSPAASAIHGSVNKRRILICFLPFCQPLHWLFGPLFFLIQLQNASVKWF